MKDSTPDQAIGTDDRLPDVISAASGANPRSTGRAATASRGDPAFGRPARPTGREAPNGGRPWRPPADLSSAVQAAQAGDEAAFRQLFNDIQPRLLRYLRTIVGEAAEDVAAEVWVQIATKLSSFEGDSAGFRGWTVTIARNRAFDHLRRERRRPTADVRVEELTDLISRDDPERSVLNRFSTHEALTLIAELPRDQADAVLLRVVVGLDAQEAGRVLGKRPGAVRTAAYRGLRGLADRLHARSASARERAAAPPPSSDPTRGTPA